MTLSADLQPLVSGRSKLTFGEIHTLMTSIRDGEARRLAATLNLGTSV